jgi:hypothetical protein
MVGLTYYELDQMVQVICTQYFQHIQSKGSIFLKKLQVFDLKYCSAS